MTSCQCHDYYIRAGATPAERIARRREVAAGKRDEAKPVDASLDKRFQSLIAPVNQVFQDA